MPITSRTLFAIDLAGDDKLAALAEPYSDRLDLIEGRSDGAGLSGLLVRPDGFVVGVGRRRK